MNILIDVGHPAHIHFFNPIIKRLEQDGHTYFLCIREKDCSVQIATSYNLNYTSKGKGSYSLIFKPFYLIRAIRKIYKTAKSFNPDIFLSFASPYAGIVASFMHKPHITFDDTESDPILQWIYKRYSSKIITPKCFQKDFGKKHLRVNSYKELSYLNFQQFQENADYKNDQDYILVRIVNHGNMHDVFGKKWDYKTKMQFIKNISEKYPVLISSEVALPKNLEKFRFNLSEDKFLQVLAHAKLLVGESATVAMESALLGIPSLFIDYNTRGYITEVEKDYNLIKHIIPSEEGLSEATEFIHQIMNKQTNQGYKERAENLHSEKENIVNFIIKQVYLTA
ncbi:MAG: DUF354 domain-containing protein [Bacteroidales bacterium]|nr:DUF354 domain-containing protein [Bacteroidales bacterium]